MPQWRVEECLGAAMCEIPVVSSQVNGQPGPASSVLSLRPILQPSIQGLTPAHLPDEAGHGAWALSQDHLLVRASVGLEPWSHLEPLPFRPAQAVPHSLTPHAFPLSATRCL